ncbi:MAG TPA: hypothetical protein VFK80_05300 [Limnochordia bacterium]|nr:hypothetical protein [Limnochordia bacterium]
MAEIVRDGDVYACRGDGFALELRADAQRHGITSYRLVGGEELIQAKLYALNAYRLLATGRLLAIARQEPFAARLEGGRLHLEWEPTKKHPAIMRWTYGVDDQGAVDVEITVEAVRAVPGYELFTSSYFDPRLQAYLVLPKRAGRTAAEDLQLYKLDGTPFIYGNYVMAPRDYAALAMRADGRWDGDGGIPIAPWSVGQHYGRPVAVMADADVHVVHLADTLACASVNASYDDPDPTDGIAHHHALYFGLFSENLPAGAVRRARLRQVVRRGSPQLGEIVGLYERFAAEVAGEV